jgi:hypothetical protein
MDHDAPLAPRFPRGQAFKVIGLGGVGSLVARYGALFLSSLDLEGRLVLVDGDAFEDRNAARMLFRELGNKAEVLCRELLEALPRSRLALEAVPEYVDEGSAARLIREGDLVLLCVDNHATRHTVARRFAALRDGILISGGNDAVGPDSSGVARRGTYGNVQVHVRADGADLTAPLDRHHPEIARPADRPPAAREPACTALLAATPQILPANFATASAMLSTLLLALSGELHYSELGFDVLEGVMRPIELPGG